MIAKRNRRRRPSSNGERITPVATGGNGKRRPLSAGWKLWQALVRTTWERSTASPPLLLLPSYSAILSSTLVRSGLSRSDSLPSASIGRRIAKTFPRSCNDAMAPGKKSKRSGKKKDPKKLKKRRSIAVAPVDPRAVDTEWWDIFWRKNSSASGSVPDNEEEGFKYFFRLSKQTFAYICSLVREDLISCPPSGLINIEGRLLSVEKQVAIALRRLASGDSQVSVGAAFGVGQSTVSQVTWRFIEALEDRGRHHLKWPDSDSAEVIKSRFEELYGLPNCCGAMDATHIIMTLPAVQTSDDWCDPANNYSMFLQGVVDHELRFLDIVTGWPGGMTVPKLLKFSGLFKLCESGARLNGPVERTSEGVPEIAREYVVGGAAYPLLPWLITPYESTELSCSAASNFNAVHESARSLAVMAFLQLKGSWRILSKVMWRPDKQKLPSIILVCCLLHNIIVDTGDKLNPDVALSGHHDSGYVEQCCKQVDPLGKTVRDNLAKYLKCVKERA